MAGRWMLSAPNAPPCGMEFEGEPGQQQGAIDPDGGCPGNFFTSRHWTFGAGHTLTIADHDNQPLAQLNLAEGRFAGQSTAGMPVTLSALNKGIAMSEYQLYCFAQSGNAYRAALMLNLIGADWEPVWYDFSARRRSARPSFAKPSMRWAKRRCWCTARRNSANRA